MAGSSTVNEVGSIAIEIDAHTTEQTGVPDSVTQSYKNGKLVSERYYGADGNAYLDIDYTDHGNTKTHPKVPHQHKIWFEGGKMKRDKTDTDVK